MTDTLHGAFAVAATVLLSAGAWRAWGDGYAMMLLGTVLLSGVIYARTRNEHVQQPD